MVDWINPAYNFATLKQVSRGVALSGNMQLISFLSKKGLAEFKNLKFKHVYDPMTYSYHVSKPPAFAKELVVVLQSLLGFKSGNLSCFAFKKGDYTVLYDKLKPAKGIAMFLDISDWDESWGGYTAFMKKNDEVVRVIGRRNALTLVNHSGLRSFTKHVNHHAKHPRIFLYGVLHK